MDIQTLLAQVTDSMSVRRAFGEPIEVDGNTIIPVAWVAGGGGGGGGTPFGHDVAPSEQYSAEGGGLGGVVWPIGSYVVKDGNVRFVPSFDLATVILASAGLVRALAAFRRRR